MLAIDSYNEYGINGAAHYGRFGYTGQVFIRETGLYDYKARMYSPTLGRFMQTDPIGYDDGVNIYNYTHSDPVNGSDPDGMMDYYGYLESSSPASSSPAPGSSGNNLASVIGGIIGAGATGLYHLISGHHAHPPKKPNTNSSSQNQQAKSNNIPCNAVSTGTTLQTGLAGQGTLGKFSYQVAAGLAFDSSSNVALYGFFGPGAGVGEGGAAGLSVQVSNAATVQDLRGNFVNVSGGGGLEFGGTIDGFAGFARNGQKVVGGGFTAGAGGGVTSFDGGTYTFVSPSFNLLGKPTC